MEGEITLLQRGRVRAALLPNDKEAPAPASTFSWQDKREDPAWEAATGGRDWWELTRPAAAPADDA